MKILAISDIHGDFSVLEDHIGKYDLLILAGDFTNESYKITKSWLDRLEPYLYVYGNHDDLGQLDIKHLIPDFEIIEYRGVSLMGINGNFAKRKRFPWHKTPAEVTYGLKKITKPVNIVVSHEPPYGYADKLRNSSVGQPVLAEALFKLKPLYWICGHINSSIKKQHYTNAIDTSGDVYNVNRNPVYLKV